MGSDHKTTRGSHQPTPSPLVPDSVSSNEIAVSITEQMSHFGYALSIVLEDRPESAPESDVAWTAAARYGAAASREGPSCRKTRRAVNANALGPDATVRRRQANMQIRLVGC
jgi:hypothetical protein